MKTGKKRKEKRRFNKEVGRICELILLSLWFVYFLAFLLARCYGDGDHAKRCRDVELGFNHRRTYETGKRRNRKRERKQEDQG